MMRNWCFVLLSVVAIVASSCVWTVRYSASEVVGNGKLVEEERMLQGFSAVDNASTFNVSLQQGEAFSFRVACEENLLPLLRTRVEDGVLFIEMTEKSVNQTRPSRIDIVLPELKSLKNSGVGNVEVRQMSGQALTVQNSGVGNLTLDIRFETMECRNSGVGNVTVTGSVGTLNLYNKGVGNVTADELNTQMARVENSGVGSVRVRCAKEISIYNHGVGSVRYSGDAIIRDLVSEGVGSVKRAD
mgnify:CR=1 FL=1